MSNALDPVFSLAALVDYQDKAIVSRTLLKKGGGTITLFAFDAGQELSEHTAAVPAIIQIIRGRATLTLGADSVEAGPGSWVHMPANLTHAVRAEEPTVMLLLLLKTPPA